MAASSDSPTLRIGGRRLLRHPPTVAVHPPPLRFGRATPHPVEIGIGQGRLQTLFADLAALTDCPSLFLHLLVVREEGIGLALARRLLEPL